MGTQYGLGIDLGTTQTAAAVRIDGRTDIVRLGGRRAEIPSLIFVREDGDLLIGEAAERRGLTEPARLAREFKRRIGDPVPILVGGVPFSAHSLTAKLLRHVIDTVTRLQGGPPAVLTVTHPANWGPYKREQLDQALRLADAGPVLLRTEPEAAALQHATARRIAPGETVAVYDLGGGTFDAAVLRREGEGFQVLGEPEGIEQLGGADFDEAVFGHVLEVLGDVIEGLDPNEPDVVAALARLRRDCVEAKEALSFDTEVMIPVALPGVHTRVRLNRSELESMIEPALRDTVAAMRRALRAAGVAPAELDAVLLAGGSSRIPLVSQLLSTAFDRPVVADPHPEHSIALGAAAATALVTGGASPFAAAAEPPPRSAAASSTPPPVTAAAHGAEEDQTGTSAGFADRTGAFDGQAAANERTGTTSVLDGHAPVAFSRGAASIPGAPPVPSAAPPAPLAPTILEPAISAPGAGERGSEEPEGSWPAPADPWKGHTGTIPPAVDAGPMTAPTQVVAPGPPVTPPIDHPPQSRGGPAPRRNGKLMALVGVLTVAVLAGSATVVLLLNRGDSDGTGTAAPASAAPSVKPPYPQDTMLVRVDTGGDSRPSRKSNVMLLTPGQPGRTLISNTGGDVLPEWSRDRSKIALTRNLPDGSNEIWVMESDGTKARKVIGDVTGGRVSWSKDGKKLAFIRLVDKRPQLFIVKLDGSDPIQLTYSDAAKDDPAWSPDGTTIAYWVDVDQERLIYLLNVDNPQEPGTRITAKGPAVDPAWSPNGKTIAYTLNTGPGLSDIWLVGGDGTNARPLVADAAREMDPSWSPDNGWVAFTRGPLERPRITIVKTDGTGEETLTKEGDREGHPCWT